MATDITDYQSKFIVAEFEALRREIEHRLTTQDHLCQWSAIGSAAIFTFAIGLVGTGVDRSIVSLAAPLPFALGLVCRYHYFALRKVIRQIAAYIKTSEVLLFPSGNVGWEHYLADNQKDREQIRHARTLFWSGLALINGVGGAVLVAVVWLLPIAA